MFTLKYIVKVKLSLYRPRQAPRTRARLDSEDFQKIAHASGKVVNPTHRPPLQVFPQPHNSMNVNVQVGNNSICLSV